jgi:hypothetical protein
MSRVKGGRNVNSGGSAHPGADARSMHGGIVVSRMLEFVRDGSAGRHRQ